LIFFLVSLVGIPFTGGFFAKFYSFSVAIAGGAVWLAIIGLLNSGLAAAYYLRLALVSVQSPDSRNGEPPVPTPQVGIAVGAALAFAVAATLILGIYPKEALRWADAGAHTLQAPPAQTIAPLDDASGPPMR
jgi:NADH-quinone oxidoreductase subunit N